MAELWELDAADLAKAIAAGEASAVDAVNTHLARIEALEPEVHAFITLTPDLIQASCLVGDPTELVDQLHSLERQGLRQIMLYPPLNRQYRVIEDFADHVMSRL